MLRVGRTVGRECKCDCGFWRRKLEVNVLKEVEGNRMKNVFILGGAWIMTGGQLGGRSPMAGHSRGQTSSS